MVHPDCLDRIICALKKRPAVVCGRIIPFGTFIERLVAVSEFGEFMFEKKMFLKNFSGGFVAMPSRIYKDFSYDAPEEEGADRLISWALHRSGVQIIFEPEAVVYYRRKLSLNSLFGRLKDYGLYMSNVRQIDDTLPHSWIMKFGPLAPVLFSIGRFIIFCYKY